MAAARHTLTFDLIERYGEVSKVEVSMQFLGDLDMKRLLNWSALIPAYRASTVNPTDALRAE